MGMHPEPATIQDLEIVVVHHLCVRPMVAMLNAFFAHYPEATITMVDNSGGRCTAFDNVLPHIQEYSHQVRLLVNPATEPGGRGPLSHGAGLDLALRRCEHPYLLSLESDTFILERGGIEYVLSLMNRGYDWAGVAQKPVDGTFASFSPCFGIFRVALLRDHNLSFRVRPRATSGEEPDDLLARHHRQAAQRARQGLPLIYPQGKPPDTYRRQPSEIERVELQHLEYFDTGEWIHHELTTRGYRGHLFSPTPWLCHAWGSRDDTVFLRNFRERLPQMNLNALLPTPLQVNTHPGPLPNKCLAVLDSTGLEPADHWHLVVGRDYAKMTARDAKLCIDFDIPQSEKAYLGLALGGFAHSPPEELDARIVPCTFYSLECNLQLSGSAQVQLWVIEYGSGARIQHHNRTVASGRHNLDFITSPKSHRFRVFIRLSGTGGVQIDDLVLSSPSLEPEQLETTTHRHSRQIEGCIVLCADALRADFATLARDLGAAAGVATLERFRAQALCPEAAYTAATWTLPSHMSMFTGLHPHEHGYGVEFKVGRTYPPPSHLTYLPHYLVEHGIPCYGFHNGGVMEPHRGLGYGWTSYDGTHPSDVDGPVHRFCEALPEMSGPFFAFIHTFAVHNYYGECSTPLCLDLVSPEQRRHLEEVIARWGNLRWLMASLLRNRQVAEAQTVEAISRLYLGAVCRFDRLLQLLLNALESMGSIDRCTIILLADHGEALGEVHGQLQYWSHMTVNVHEENIKVPFMLRPARGISPSLAEPLSLVDLPNLVAACLGLPEVFPKKPAGTVFATGATDQFGEEWERTISAGQRAYRSALITGERKYHLVGDAFEVEKTCDLKSDPGETAPIGDAVPRPELQDLLKHFVRPISFGRNRSAEVDADVLERLRDLGYVE